MAGRSPHVTRSGLTVSNRLARLVLGVASARGVDARSLLLAAGAESESLSDPEGRLPIEVEHALWEEAARITGDAAFGLACAAAYRPGQLAAFDYVVLNAPTLRASIDAVIRYNRLLHDTAAYTLESRGPVARFVHRTQAGSPLPRPAAEFVAGSMLTVAREALGPAFTLRGVGLTVPTPASAAPYAAWFGTRAIRFGEDALWVEFDAALLDRPLLRADSGLFDVLSRHAEALLAALPPAGDLRQRLRVVLAAQVREGTPTIASVAKALHMSARTLQRRLADEGGTFQRELDDLREGLARRYLADPSLPISEVAFLLGFSDARAFHRAFKQWTGATPGELRGARR